MRKKGSVLILTIIFLLSQILAINPVFGQSTDSISGTKAPTDRIAGEDRYKTAVAVSRQGWNTAEYAVLVRGDNFADALCAGPLAYKYGGPILLTQTDGLNSDTLTELKRLGVKHLFIVGGAGAVSQNVENALKDKGIATVERIYGNDRYETSVKIAEKLGTVSQVVLATGSDFPDALSISGIAARSGMPILLVSRDSLQGSVAGFLQENTITRAYVVGGTGVISTVVEKMLPAPLRLAGADRYETNTAIMKQFDGDLDFEKIYAAVGSGFADALTGAVLAAKTASPLILTGSTLPAVTEEYLETKLKLATKVLGLGGKNAVPASILTGILVSKEIILVEEKYGTAGTYGPETGTKTIQGSVIISAADVILRNTVIKGDLLLGQSIGDGNVTLSGVTVLGKTIVNGGGPNSVIMYNFNGQTVVVDVPDGASVRLVAQGSTSITNVTMESNGRLEESGLTGTGFVNVEIPAGAQVTLSGSFAEVRVEAGSANVSVTSGTISTLTIAESAGGAGINLASGSTVTTFNANAQSSITGQGQITTANVNVNGVAIEHTPTSITIVPGVTANVGGQILTGTTSSGGGGGTPQIQATAITTADVSVTKGSIDFSYDFTAGGTPVTFGLAKAAPYYLDITTSTVQLKRDGMGGPGFVSTAIPLSNLVIGDDGQLIYSDFGALSTAFGNTITNGPTHIKLHLVSKTSANGSTISNPWTYDSDWISFAAGEQDVFYLYGDKESLLIKNSSGDQIAGAALLDISSNLILDTTGMFGSTITWASSNTAVIANNGSVTRPAFGAANATVTLTASITKGALTETKAFDLTVMSAQAGNAAQFNSGANTFISVPSSPELKVTTALTIEGWIKPNGGGEWTLVMGKQFNGADANPWYSYRFLAASVHAGEQGFPRRISFDIAPEGSGEVGVTSTSVIQNDVWTHIAGVYDGATMKIYVNGVLENTVAQTGNIRTSDFPIYIGKAPWTNYNNYNGQMDELRVWNVARTQAQINAAMSNGLTGTETGLVAYWTFNEAPGSATTDDASSNSNVGTLNNGAVIVADSTAPVYEASQATANLIGLALSGSPVNYTFSGGTYTYSGVTVANGIANITVTPTGAGTITVDGTTVASGSASGDIALTAGVERTITIVAIESGKTPKTYTIRITRDI